MLAHALHGRHKAESLTLVEANPLAMLRTAGEESLFAMVGSMTKVYFAEFEAGKPDAASHVVDFYGGARTFETFPSKVRDYIISTTASNVRDWTSGMSFAPALPDYGRITAPTLVIRGAKSHPTMLRTAELLAVHIPDASLETIDGGSHFLPATHPNDVAQLVKAHIGRVGG